VMSGKKIGLLRHGGDAGMSWRSEKRVSSRSDVGKEGGHSIRELVDGGAAWGTCSYCKTVQWLKKTTNENGKNA